MKDSSGAKGNIFDTINDWIRNSEASLVNLLSAIAPWGAPLAPAYMSYVGMSTHLKFPGWVAFILATVIEILGLATVHTTLIFWQHNRRYSKEYKRMPTKLAAGMFCLYLVVILTTNVLMEALVDWSGMPILARALLSLLAVPAAVTMAIRTQHTEMIKEMRGKTGGNLPERSGGKKAERSERKVSENLPETSAVRDWRKLPDEDKAIIATLSTAEIVQRYDVPERTARNWGSRANTNGSNHNGNHKDG